MIVFHLMSSLLYFTRVDRRCALIPVEKRSSDNQHRTQEKHTTKEKKKLNFPQVLQSAISGSFTRNGAIYARKFQGFFYIISFEKVTAELPRNHIFTSQANISRDNAAVIDVG